MVCLRTKRAPHSAAWLRMSLSSGGCAPRGPGPLRAHHAACVPHRPATHTRLRPTARSAPEACAWCGWGVPPQRAEFPQSQPGAAHTKVMVQAGHCPEVTIRQTIRVRKGVATHMCLHSFAARSRVNINTAVGQAHWHNGIAGRHTRASREFADT